MGKRGGRHRSTADTGGTRWFLRVLPLLLIAGGAGYEYLTPSGFSGSPLFSAAPLVAAPFFSLRSTILAGLGSIAAIVAVHLRYTRTFGSDIYTEIATVATVCVLACFINRIVRRSNEQLDSARQIAQAAQFAVLPEPADRIGGLAIAARYEAAQAGAFIGGDLYAVQDTPYGVRIIVGDVRGKGMGAVAAVAVVIGAFREAAEQEGSLEAVALRLERALAREGTRRSGIDDFEGFTTAVLAEIRRGSGRVRILNRGHPAPIVLLGDGTVRLIEPEEAALPLGMGELGAWPDRVTEAEFPGAATLLLYTDGLSEARNASGVFYDPAARLAGRIFPGPEELLAALALEVSAHTGGGARDDMALLAVRRP
ncbi:PP2C family protein-serine/threonine phosphatase [Streptomyces sp. VRA16 Mangrove soil]|uniref:PP2C family protein-serine/threonine phosphatase n=1 Tax=Streptomyces sp. VRA16 Mangrove soil TaxID=2817434 RepID=UPI001A9CEC8A|nr:PP2C family protein-serine/threonine phosphatase [Streptomyces sp. VRA16 Mangrove soil]MBO1338084.1 serine/threonine-protein phosphatase [Streptomyces sp. VRA16 Mangrove soil]